MKYYSSSFNYEFDWPTVTLAYFIRYPNPHAKHVLASDVINRYIDQQGRLHSTRLILKRGKLPAWGARILNISETYVIEESIVDPHNRVMRTESRNLDHTKVLKVIENQTMTELPTGSTQVITDARMISTIPSFVGSKIEGLGVTKFRENFEKSRLGMQVVLDALKRENGKRVGLGVRWRSVREWQARI